MPPASGDAQQIVLGEASTFLQRHRASTTPPVGLALRARFNPTLDKGWFGSVMDITNNVTMLSPCVGLGRGVWCG